MSIQENRRDAGPAPARKPRKKFGMFVNVMTRMRSMSTKLGFDLYLYFSAHSRPRIHPLVQRYATNPPCEPIYGPSTVIVADPLL